MGFGKLTAVLPESAGDSTAPLAGVPLGEFWKSAKAEDAGLTVDEFAATLLKVGTKSNFGLPPGTTPSRNQITYFLSGLQLEDLALAHACALGRDEAWRIFLAKYREPLLQAATALTRSASGGQELADGLYSSMFGLSERDGERQSPLTYYSGRGSFLGFLRATLAQRHVDALRRSSRETELPAVELAAANTPPDPSPVTLRQLQECLKCVLQSVTPEDRFLLVSWFLDQRTLLEISRVLQVHEATVSRRITRLTGQLRQEMLACMVGSGMSPAAAKDAMGTDPRDIEINLRTVLQGSQTATFQERSRTDSQ